MMSPLYSPLCPIVTTFSSHGLSFNPNHTFGWSQSFILKLRTLLGSTPNTLKTNKQRDIKSIHVSLYILSLVSYEARKLSSMPWCKRLKLNHFHLSFIFTCPPSWVKLSFYYIYNFTWTCIDLLVEMVRSSTQLHHAARYTCRCKCNYL